MLRRLPGLGEGWEQVMALAESEEDDDGFSYNMEHGMPFRPANQVWIPPIAEQ